MYAILAEDDSDAEVLTVVVRRYLHSDRIPIKRKGYEGCSGLCAKGARDIRTWANTGIKLFIICHDADAHPPNVIKEKVMKAVVQPTGLNDHCCIIVPVEEIEAWLIADAAAISAVIPSFEFGGHNNPESIRDPKEWLVKESIAHNGRPLYSPKTFNEKVARHLDLDVVARKCPSFRSLIDWLKGT